MERHNQAAQCVFSIPDLVGLIIIFIIRDYVNHYEGLKALSDLTLVGRTWPIAARSQFVLQSCQTGRLMSLRNLKAITKDCPSLNEWQYKVAPFNVVDLGWLLAKCQDLESIQKIFDNDCERLLPERSAILKDAFAQLYIPEAQAQIGWLKPSESNRIIYYWFSSSGFRSTSQEPLDLTFRRGLFDAFVLSLLNDCKPGDKFRLNEVSFSKLASIEIMTMNDKHWCQSFFTALLLRALKTDDPDFVRPFCLALHAITPPKCSMTLLQRLILMPTIYNIVFGSAELWDFAKRIFEDIWHDPGYNDHIDAAYSALYGTLCGNGPAHYTLLLPCHELGPAIDYTFMVDFMGYDWTVGYERMKEVEGIGIHYEGQPKLFCHWRNALARDVGHTTSINYELGKNGFFKFYYSHFFE